MLHLGWQGDPQKNGRCRRRHRSAVVGQSIVVVSLLATVLALVASPAGAQETPPPLANAEWIEFGVDGFEDATPYGINSAGDITGNYAQAYEDDQGFVRLADGTTVAFTVPDSSVTEPYAINDAGTIAGAYRGTVDTSLTGFFRTADGTITSFEPPNATYTRPTEINVNGDIAGDYRIGGQRNAFIRFADGTYTTFTNTTISSLNASGQVAGIHFPAGGGSLGFIGEPDGTITTFTVPGAPVTRPRVISDDGTVIGNHNGPDHRLGFVRYPDGTIETIDVPGSSSVDPEDINADGVIVGDYDDLDDLRHGFALTPDGTFSTFFYPLGLDTRIAGINDAGTIVGVSYEVIRDSGRDTTRRFGVLTTINCQAGSFSATGLQPCAQAPAGSFVAGSGATESTLCAAGSFSAAVGADACTLAPVGSFVPVAGATQATLCPEGTQSLVEGATSCDPIAVDERTAITDAAAALDDIVANTTGRDRRVLAAAAANLDRALRDGRWVSDTELNSQRAAATYRNVAVAIAQIDWIADRTDDPVLQAELDQVTEDLLDTMRSLAQAKIDEATAAGGAERPLTRASRQLGFGDASRSADFLARATTHYGNAWQYANAA